MSTPQAWSSSRVEEERSSAFIPAGPWPVGEHQLDVDHRLEDTAANSVSRVFDRDLHRPEHERRAEQPAVIPFVVRPQ